MNCKYKYFLLFAFWGLVACQPSIDEQYAEANLAFQEDRYEQAIPIYEALLARQLDDNMRANMYAKMGISYAYAGQYEKCTESIQRALEAKIDQYEVYDMGALCHEHLKQPDKAMVLYKEGIEKFPDRYEFKNRAAISAFRNKDVNQAMEWLAELAEKNPKNVDWNYSAGTVAEELKNYKQAELYYRRVLEQKPSYSNASFSLGSIFEKQGQPEIARGYYEKTLKYNANHLSALLNLAQLEQETEPDKSLVHWKKYLEIAEKKKQSAEMIENAKKQIKLLESGTK